MQTTRPGLIDGDGHLIESLEEMAEFLEPVVRQSALGQEGMGSTIALSRTSLFGTLDGLHFARMNRKELERPPARQRVNASEHRMGSAKDWTAFLDKAGFQDTVLFTTEGLQVGLLRNPDYAVSLCRSYNDYVAFCYHQQDPRIHPIALIPMQDPKAAALELRRAVKELGLAGAMLPSTGLPLHLGHEYYWPVYQEAADLGCVLGVHGGSNRGIGLDTFNALTPSHMLHHPVPLMYAFVSFVYDGVFDRFPDLRVAFLEGGCAWVALLLDRAEREAEFGDSPRRPFQEYLTGGQVLIGCEGVDSTLPYMAKRIGIEPFAYSSDYPHEVDFAAAQHEIEETREKPGLSTDEKAAVLGGNAKRFYNL
jgi:hypothetical protein